MSAASVALYNRWRDLMRSWGFTVLEASGCDTQSASTRAANPAGMFLEHHDASSKLSGNWGSLATILAGRSGIPPRLANLQFARNGQVTITCKNVANHGGVGGPLLGVPLNDVNVHSCGAEVANDGLGEPYSPELTRALVSGEAAWAIVTGRTADYVRGHKEWAPGRKFDPVLDMNGRRAQVAAVIASNGPLPVPQQEDDDMKFPFFAYHDDQSQKDEQGKPGSGAIFLAAPGTWYGVPSMGHLTLHKALGHCGDPVSLAPNVIRYLEGLFLSSEANDQALLAQVAKLSEDEAKRAVAGAQ